MIVPSFSLAALTVLELAPPELIDVAAACGYDHVGIRLLPATPGGIAYPLMDDEAALKETIARLDATGVTVADLEVVAFRPETEIAAFSAFFETGARLGARHILVAAYDPELDRFTDRFAAFCEAAAPYGLSADLEFMPWTSVPDLATARRIVETSREGQCRRPGGCAALRQVGKFDRRPRAAFPPAGCTIGNCATARPSGRRHRKK